MPAITIADLAALLDADFEGDGDLLVERPDDPENEPGGRALAVATAPQFAEKLRGRGYKAAVLAAGDDWQQYGLEAAILVRRPRYALAAITRHFAGSGQGPAGIHPTAVVDDGATIGDGVSIGPFCVIGPGATIGEGTQIRDHVTIGADAVVGAGCFIKSGVRIGDAVTLGRQVIVHENAVIGTDGFSFVTPEPSESSTKLASSFGVGSALS